MRNNVPPTKQLCRFIGGTYDGAVMTSRLSTFPDGTIRTVVPTEMRPDWLALYIGDLPFSTNEPVIPVMKFAGWVPKSLATCQCEKRKP